MNMTDLFYRIKKIKKADIYSHLVKKLEYLQDKRWQEFARKNLNGETGNPCVPVITIADIEAALIYCERHFGIPRVGGEYILGS